MKTIAILILFGLLSCESGGIAQQCPSPTQQHNPDDDFNDGVH